MRILIVCLGNICRSPTAEAVMRRRAPAGTVIASAGTSNWHAGHPPDPRMQEAARRRGYDLSALRARQVTVEDFARYDLILAMDRQNLSDLHRLAPPDTTADLRLFLEGGTPDEMPDPYYTGTFDQVVDLVETACRRWLPGALPDARDG